jgi:hypothetical protein
MMIDERHYDNFSLRVVLLHDEALLLGPICPMCIHTLTHENERQRQEVY